MSSADVQTALLFTTIGAIAGLLLLTISLLRRLIRAAARMQATIERLERSGELIEIRTRTLEIERFLRLHE